MAGLHRQRQRRDVARRTAAFEAACRATDLLFGDAYAMQKIPRPSVSDRQNPMQVCDDTQFLARYRYCKEIVLELLGMLPLQASRNNRALSLPPIQELLLTLGFCGAGNHNAEVYRNGKGDSSLKAQAVTGPELEFFDLGASWPGSVHDCRIFDNSRVRVIYEEHRMPGVLLGDMGYACPHFLMTPLADPGTANAPRGSYNKAHIRIRNSVERAFGVWKRRLPCLDMCL